MQPTPINQIDQALETLNNQRHHWAALPLQERINLIDTLIGDLGSQAGAWVKAAVAAKRGVGLTAVEAQEWAAGPYAVLRNLRLLRQSLVGIQKTGKPVIPGPVTTTVSGQVSAQVFPANIYDKLFFAGTTAEVWMQPEVTHNNLKDHMAAAYNNDEGESEICLVLGAGNVSSIGPMDCLYKLFNEKKLVIVKMHPVNAYLGTFFEKSLAALINRGYLQLVYGDADEGSYLCNHVMVDEIHITGSDRTHDLIVFGPDVEKAKAAREPVLRKPITSELGNVSPFIIVPGQWSKSDLRFQAEHIVSTLANNSGFNCNASRVLITHQGWPQRQAFLDEIRAVFKELPPRSAYYPGAPQRYDDFLKHHAEAEQYGVRTDNELPWMMVSGLDPDQPDDICFKQEAFCSLFAETALEGEDTTTFLNNAVNFANDTLWGTLNASILVHPNTLKSPEVAQAFDQAVPNLRFGTVAINHWAAIGYALVTPTWGAFPGHDLYDIQSGRDVVHNTFMFDKPQKSVVRGPFIQKPKPLFFVSHKKAGNMGRKLTEFEATRSWFKLPALFASALSG